MFQTSAGGQVGSPTEVANSDASAIELYEERIWEAGVAPLGAASNRTLAEWNEALHQRRRVDYPRLGDPAPSVYTFTSARRS